MKKALDLKGKKFGYLTVIKRVPCNAKVKYARWLCKCDCGNEKEAIATKLKNGITTNCGCESRKLQADAKRTHGMRNNKIYHVWVSMKQRCTNPNATHSQYYYDKGIGICKKWLKFEGFYDDMGYKYHDGLYLDRIDNLKGYELSNCKWVTVTQSNQNKSNVLTIEKVKEIRSSNKSRVNLAKEYGVCYMTIKKILTHQSWKEV